MHSLPEVIFYCMKLLRPPNTKKVKKKKNKNSLTLIFFCRVKGRRRSAAFMNDFLCNLKGRVIISFGMLLVCSGNDCPTAPRLFAQHYSRAWKSAIHHHPYSAQQRLLTRKTPLLKKQSDYPQLVVRVWKMYHKEPRFNLQDEFLAQLLISYSVFL